MENSKIISSQVRLAFQEIYGYRKFQTTLRRSREFWNFSDGIDVTLVEGKELEDSFKNTRGDLSKVNSVLLPLFKLTYKVTKKQTM